MSRDVNEPLLLDVSRDVIEPILDERACDNIHIAVNTFTNCI